MALIRTPIIDRFISADFVDIRNRRFGSYLYDAICNIRTKSEGGSSHTYTYDVSNRLSHVSGTGLSSLGYDPRGNVTSFRGHGYTYNLAGNLVSSINPGISYKYDGHKRRVQRTEGGQTTYTVYSQAGQMRHKRAGGVSTDYIYAGSMLVGTKSGGTVNYVHTDLLGSPIDGRVGSTSYTENYMPWGEKLDNPVQLAGDVGYTGHQSDVATGLTYMQARYYDPVIGRFMGVDPVGFNGGNTQYFGRYTYAGNNPINAIDPDGRDIVYMFANDATQAHKRQTMEYLSKSPTARNEISRIEKSKATYTISFDLGADRHGYDSGSRTITTNPALGQIVKSSNAVQSPALMTAHEISHAAEHDRIGTEALENNLEAPVVSLTPDGANTNVVYGTSVEEQRATSVESQIAGELGEAARTSYKDQAGPVKTCGPTESTRC